MYMVHTYVYIDARTLAYTYAYYILHITCSHVFADDLIYKKYYCARVAKYKSQTVYTAAPPP